MMQIKMTRDEAEVTAAALRSYARSMFTAITTRNPANRCAARHMMVTAARMATRLDTALMGAPLTVDQITLGHMVVRAYH